MTSEKRKTRGFTLIEVMITAAVIALLVTIAYPSYSRTIIKVRRSDGHEALMKAVALQEQFYLDNKRYATKMSELGYLDKNGSPTDSPPSREGYYAITVSASTASTFTLQAQPAGSQAADTYCDKLRIDDKGVKSQTGTSSVAACW